MRVAISPRRRHWRPAASIWQPSQPRSSTGRALPKPGANRRPSSSSAGCHSFTRRLVGASKHAWKPGNNVCQSIEIQNEYRLTGSERRYNVSQMAPKPHARSRKQRGPNAPPAGPRVVPPEHLRDVGGPRRVYARRLVGRRDAVVHGPHAHRFLEIVFIEKGRGAHVVEGKRVPVGPGDVFALAPGQSHDPDGLDSTIHWVLAFELRFLFEGRDARGLFVTCPDEVVLLCFLRRPNDGVHLRLSPENAR